MNPYEYIRKISQGNVITLDSVIAATKYQSIECKDAITNAWINHLIEWESDKHWVRTMIK